MATIRQTRLSAIGLAVSAWTLSAGIAAATPAPAPAYHWCPGQSWDAGWGSIYDWDWNQCHDWQRAAGQGGPMAEGPWGVPPSWAPPKPPPPSWAPGANVMWNQTARGWGFWNNRIWTAI